MGTGFYVNPIKSIGPCKFLVNITFLLAIIAIAVAFISFLFVVIGGCIKMGSRYTLEADPSYLASFGYGFAMFTVIALFGTAAYTACGRFEIVDKSLVGKK